MKIKLYRFKYDLYRIRFFLLIVIYIPVSFISIYSQSIITTSADHKTTETIHLSWTIGEGITETFMNSGNMLTQGMCQGNFMITAVEELEGAEYLISAFPNPVANYCLLQIEGDRIGNLIYVLYDINGKILLKNKIENNKSIIPMVNFNPSAYFLKIYSNEQVLKIFKIIKQ